jgi:hypothetical protein
MRTQQEIVARIESKKRGDMFGFETNDLKMALDFEHIQPYLDHNQTTTQEEWEKGGPYTPEACRQQIRDYLPFAWEKAESERGISASRSISHFEQWIWLAGDDDVLARVDAASFAMYGKPKLKIIEDHYGRVPLETSTLPLPATTPSTTTSEKPDTTMPDKAPEIMGEALAIDLGFIVINQTNGKLECFRGPSAVGGLTSGNVRAMLVARTQLDVEFSKASELTTDASSPDDAPAQPAAAGQA